MGLQEEANEWRSKRKTKNSYALEKVNFNNNLNLVEEYDRFKVGSEVMCMEPISESHPIKKYDVLKIHAIEKDDDNVFFYVFYQGWPHRMKMMRFILEHEL